MRIMKRNVKKHLCLFSFLIYSVFNLFWYKKSTTFKINIASKYKIEHFGSLEPRKVTVVAHYFHLNQSKHKNNEYERWLSNFFSSVSSPLVLFTDKHASIENLLYHRKMENMPTTIYKTKNIWNIMSEIELERKRNYTWNYKNQQLKLDRESHIHTPNLYALWNLKSFMLNKIAQVNIYNSTAFIYTDSGAWRDKLIKNWPDEEIVDNLIHLSGGRILLGQLVDAETYLTSDSNGQRFPDVDLIEGTFFMGSREAVSYFKEEFWRIHDQKFDRGEFVGKDQTIMNIFAFQNHKNIENSCVKLEIWRRDCNLECNMCDADWFFYQNYLAPNKYYNCTKKRETLLSIWREF